MKKFTTMFLLLFGVLMVGSINIKGEDKNLGDLTIHFIAWDDESYEGLGSHGWGGIDAKPAYVDEDQYGVYFEFKDIDLDSDGDIGFIAVTYVNGSPDWDNGKLTGDVNIKKSDLKPGVTNHVFVFQGAETRIDNPSYYVSSEEHLNLLLVYVDPSGSYEENIGVHAWNGWVNDADKYGVNFGQWASPALVFTNGASHTAVPTVKVAMMQADFVLDEEENENVEAGLLIYAGADENKKTGDVTLEGALKGAYGDDHAAKLGDVGVAYVYSKGNAYTTNDNVLYEKEQFVKEAFSFRILPMGIDPLGGFTGTYAPRPDQVLVSLSANIASPFAEAETEADETAARTKIISWFTVTDEDDKELEIEDVHFDVGSAALKDFVLILKENFDTTKDYTLSFDLGLENANENRSDSIEIDLDRKAPDLVFSSPVEIVGKPEAERIILVAWDKKFNLNQFPSFIASDDRDGDITKMVYVPKGEFSTINTNVEGDYKIVLRVEDSWGNVKEETFIFRVTKDIK